jgi:hypothetical protein
MTLDEWKVLRARPGKQPDSLTCPRCGLTSHDPTQVKDAYCGHCHIFLHDIAEFLLCFMSHEDARRARRLKYVYARTLLDGRFLAVEAALPGGAFLKLCSDDIPHSLDGVDDVWQYDHLAFAIHAAATWEPAKQIDKKRLEPFGFCRHPTTGRRRPFGNPLLESIHE